jgi:hypothetical protein
MSAPQQELMVKDIEIGDRLECIHAFGQIAAGERVKVIGRDDWDIIINVKSDFTKKPLRLGNNGTRLFKKI